MQCAKAYTEPLKTPQFKPSPNIDERRSRMDELTLVSFDWFRDTYNGDITRTKVSPLPGL